MKFIFYIFFFSFSLWSLVPEEVLRDKIPVGDKRYHTMLTAIQLMKERDVQVVVETGASRYGDKNCIGDGCSTLLFSRWLNYLGGREFFSVDIDPQAIENARASTEYETFFVCEDSISFLSRFERSIDFLYLDSYDFDSENPAPSQTHHFREILAAYPKLTRKSVVMVDDCDLPFGGKGTLVIHFLLKRGWRIVAKGYQTILVFSEDE